MGLSGNLDGATLGRLHFAMSFWMVRKLQIKGWNERCEREESLKGNLKRVCFSNTEEITCPGRLPIEYISTLSSLLATNQQNKYDTTSVCQATWGYEPLVHTIWKSLWRDLDGTVPGGGEYSVDNWILRVLGAHEKHVLWKHKVGAGEGEAV